MKIQELVKDANDEIDYNKLSKEDKTLLIKLNQTIKKVTDAIENNYHFNTAIAANMELINEVQTYVSSSMNSEQAAKDFRLYIEENNSYVISICSSFL